MMKSDNINQLLNWTFMRKATAADIVRRIQTGDNPNGRDFEKSTPLHKAIQAYNFEAFRALLEYGADPLVRDSSGYSLADQIQESFGNAYGSQRENLRRIQSYLSGQSSERLIAMHERAEEKERQKEKEKAERRYRREYGLWHPKYNQYFLPTEGHLYEEAKEYQPIYDPLRERYYQYWDPYYQWAKQRMKEREEQKRKEEEEKERLANMTEEERALEQKKKEAKEKQEAIFGAVSLGTLATIFVVSIAFDMCSEFKKRHNREPKKDPVVEVDKANTNQTVVVSGQNQATNITTQVYRDHAKQME